MKMGIQGIKNGLPLSREWTAAGIQKNNKWTPDFSGVEKWMQYYVYILASKRNGTLYIGSTSGLIKRVWQHKNKVVEGFTKKYGVNKLVHYEIAESQEAAAQRERQLKKWNRAWKIRLIEETNPEWRDLYEDLIDN